MARLLDVQQTVFQLLPEAGRRPVFDGKAGALRNLSVLTAEEPLQLVTEMERVRPAVFPLAQVVERKPQSLANPAEPLEVGRPEAVGAAVDRALGTDQLGVPFAVLLVLATTRPSCS